MPTTGRPASGVVGGAPRGRVRACVRRAAYTTIRKGHPRRFMTSPRELGAALLLTCVRRFRVFAALRHSKKGNRTPRRGAACVRVCACALFRVAYHNKQMTGHLRRFVIAMRVLGAAILLACARMFASTRTLRHPEGNRTPKGMNQSRRKLIKTPHQPGRIFVFFAVIPQHSTAINDDHSRTL